MSKKNKITLITNLILVGVFSIVSLIFFLPENIVPIYGGKEIKAIYNGNREKKQVSLMFNVYENTDIVCSIIDILDEYKVKATFFVGGCWADDNGKTLNKILSSGHEIANHGYFHKDHAKISYDKNKEEIYLTEKIVLALSGARTNLFAPPSGSFSSNTLEACYELGYKVIMWSKDTIDWRDADKNLVYKRATNGVTNGDLILMHPKEHTLLALSDVLRYYIDNGFSVVTVSENIS